MLLLEVVIDSKGGNVIGYFMCYTRQCYANTIIVIDYFDSILYTVYLQYTYYLISLGWTSLRSQSQKSVFICYTNKEDESDSPISCNSNYRSRK